MFDRTGLDVWLNEGWTCEAEKAGSRALSETLKVALKESGSPATGGGRVAEEGRAGPDREGSEAEVRGANLEDPETAVSCTSRLERRLEALECRQRQPELRTPLKLLTTDELQQVLALIARGGVLPSGEVRNPWVFQEATPAEWEALERWRKLCGEPLDHLEAAEELLDRMGEAYGWRSPEALDTALLLKRLELSDESPWFVGKTAEAVVNFYAKLEEHKDELHHPEVRAAVRRLERLEEIDRVAPGRESASEENGRTPDSEAPQSAQDLAPGHGTQGGTESFSEEPERQSWWRRVFGG